MPSAYGLLRPLLFALPNEFSHRAALLALKACAGLGLSRPPPPTASKTVMGIRFPNPLGLAAGFDKNAEAVDACAALGFGFIEAGAITPLPQRGNPKPRLFRIPEHEAIINRMGFNNCGMAQAQKNLISRRRRGEGSAVLGINIGKNANTPVSHAVDDYKQCMESLYECADFFTINVSCPNSEGLRGLQSPSHLRSLLNDLIATRDALAQRASRRVPLAVKLSPDLDDGDLPAIAKTIAEAGIDGVIACNTTTSRYQLRMPAGTESGGLSGAPLAPDASAMTCRLRDLLPPRVAIIAVGGIMSAADARARLRAGADLLQIYTGLVYRGPSLVSEILANLREVDQV